MKNATRTLAAGALGVGTVLTAVSMALMPDFSGTTADVLTAVAASNTAVVSAVGFVAAQLFLAVGFVGLAHLLRHRTPVLATTAGTLLVLSCFGHAVWGGISLLMLLMGADTANLEVYAQLIDRAQSSPVVVPFMAMGTLALVLGSVLLGVALMRAKLGPFWLGPALIAWVPLEFGGSALGQWAVYASGALYVAIFGVLTVLLQRSSLGHWQTAIEAEVQPEVSAASAPVAAVRTSSGGVR